MSEWLAKTLEEQGEHSLAGCVRCGLWDRDEEGRLMCVCTGKQWEKYHPIREDEE